MSLSTTIRIMERSCGMETEKRKDKIQLSMKEKRNGVYGRRVNGAQA